MADSAERESGEARRPNSESNLDSLLAIYRENLPRLYGFFLHRGLQKVTAEDLTQETFEALLAAFQRGTPIENPRAWLLGVARHKLVDHFRRADRRKRAVSRLEPRNPAADTDPVSWTLELLERVPPRQRLALILRYVDDLPTPRVAKLMRRSIRATESLLARGRKSLTKELRKNT